MADAVTCEIDGALAIVTFDNSARLNAIDQPIAEGLARVTGELGRDDRVGIWWVFRQTPSGPTTPGVVERVCLT